VIGDNPQGDQGHQPLVRVGDAQRGFKDIRQVQVHRDRQDIHPQHGTDSNEHGHDHPDQAEYHHHTVPGRADHIPASQRHNQRQNPESRRQQTILHPAICQTLPDIFAR